MAKQLGLNLPVRPALGREDFVLAPSNAVAVAMIDAPWPLGKLALSGPEGAGKTHLAHVWAKEANAHVVFATDLAAADLEALAASALVVEDVPLVANDPVAEEALFHLHNMLLAEGHPLLMTGRAAPNLWHMQLPDLQSRIDAAGHAALEAPDDALLSVVLYKLFNDRGLRPRDDVVPYLIKRMERSFAAAGALVTALDARSLAEGREITRNFASTVLDNLA